MWCGDYFFGLIKRVEKLLSNAERLQLLIYFAKFERLVPCEYYLLVNTLEPHMKACFTHIVILITDKFIFKSPLSKKLNLIF